MKNLLSMAVLIGLAFGMSEAVQPATSETQRAAAASDVSAIATASNSFACDLYGRFRSEKGNLFLSPASVHTALTMTYAGAAGQTAEQMAKTLHLDLPADRVQAAAGQLCRQLNNPPLIKDKPAYELVVSNALWPQAGYPFKDAFIRLIETQYGAKIQRVDYTQPEQACRTINDAVAEATRDKIKDLISPDAVNGDTKLVLTNAIYFKGKWDQQFSERATKDGPFCLADGQVVTVPLMHRSIDVLYAEGDDFQLADIPYEDGVLSMTVILPRSPDKLPAVEEKLTGQALAGWIDKAEQRSVDLTLPRFKFASSFELSKVLIGLGMVDAFGNADFSGMTDAEKLAISAVLHKAFIAVDEKGTEAAAATAVVVARASMPIEPVVFRADRPFVFIIRHRPTETILFMGRVNDPR